MEFRRGIQIPMLNGRHERRFFQICTTHIWFILGNIQCLEPTAHLVGYSYHSDSFGTYSSRIQFLPEEFQTERGDSIQLDNELDHQYESDHWECADPDERRHQVLFLSVLNEDNGNHSILFYINLFNLHFVAVII